MYTWKGSDDVFESSQVGKEQRERHNSQSKKLEKYEENGDTSPKRKYRTYITKNARVDRHLIHYFNGELSLGMLQQTTSAHYVAVDKCENAR